MRDQPQNPVNVVAPQPIVSSQSALAQRVEHLLGLMPAPATNERVLLVDASAEQRRLLARHGAHVVHVSQAGAGSAAAAPRNESSGRGEIGSETHIATQLYQDSLLPRVALALASGRFVSAAPSERAPYVAMEDAAMVAALVLSSPPSEPASLLLTGPAAFHHRELCAMASQLFSRRILVETVRPDELARTLTARGLTQEEAELSAQADAALHHTLAVLSPDVARFTGMLPISMRGLLMRERQALLSRAAQLPKRRPALANLTRSLAPRSQAEARSEAR